MPPRKQKKSPTAVNRHFWSVLDKSQNGANLRLRKPKDGLGNSSHPRPLPAATLAAHGVPHETAGTLEAALPAARAAAQAQVDAVAAEREAIGLAFARFDAESARLLQERLREAVTAICQSMAGEIALDAAGLARRPADAGGLHALRGLYRLAGEAPRDVWARLLRGAGRGGGGRWPAGRGRERRRRRPTAPRPVVSTRSPT